ncbi:CENP-S associating centromere protein X-domain-containing protein [Daldinia bambusicola]|nr:CENP-S associating centromere protein X-domain-containing protein [Daldinia bambusicola]
MPPKQSTGKVPGRGASGPSAKSRASGSSSFGSRAHNHNHNHKEKQARARAQTATSDASDADPFAEEEERRGGRRRQDDTMEVDGEGEGGMEEEEEEEEVEERKTIPPELLTHVLHQFFEKDGTRVSRDANAAIAKYMDIFVREAIARTVVEKEKGFLEVEDLEKIAPQLLLDL